MAKRRLAMTVGVLAMLAVGVTAAAAGARGGPEIKAVEPVPIVDDSNPPAVPPAKAEAVTDADLLRVMGPPLSLTPGTAIPAAMTESTGRPIQTHGYASGPMMSATLALSSIRR